MLRETLQVAVAEAEWERQAKRFIELGFHKELGLSEKDYLGSLPRLTFSQDLNRGFDFTVVVETRIPIDKQCELAGIEMNLDPSKIDNWPDKKGYVKPATPYVAQLNSGRQSSGMSLDKMTAELEDKRKKERRGTVLDGIALVIAHPEVLDSQGLILPGSAYGVFDVLKLFKDRSTGKVVMSNRFFAFKDTDPTGIVTCAR